MSLPDSRIHIDAVHRTIVATKTRTIWTPSTTLAAMGIERWPHESKLNYNQVKRILAELEAMGVVVKRPRLHSHFTLLETAYERADRQ